MNETLRILVVEDNPADADFVHEMLTPTGSVNYQIESVSRLAEALTRLESKGIDLVLLDLGLPDSHGLATFHKLRQAAPDVPVIVLTGTNDQELAVTAVRDGAQDYLVKGQGSGSLLARAARYAMERQRAETALREREKKYRGLFESSRDAIMTMEPPSWKFTSGNPAAVKMFGVKNEEEFVSLGLWELSPEWQPDGRASAEKSKEMINKAVREGSHFFEWTHQRLGGGEFPADVLLSKIEQDGKVVVHATVRDITEQKRLQQELLQSQKTEAIGRRR